MQRRRPAQTWMLRALAVGSLAPGCWSGAALPLVRARAGYDLDCPQDEIRLEEELGSRFLAIGCGRKARYRAACDGLRCVVRGDGEPAIPWRDRPLPGETTP